MSSPTLNRLATDLRNPSLRSNSPIGTPDLSLRYGKVINWSKNSGLVDITLADDSLVLFDVERLSNYIPAVGDDVWVLVSGPDMVVLDRTANSGPSLFSQVAWGYGGPDIKVINGFDNQSVMTELNGTAFTWMGPITPAQSNIRYTTIGTSVYAIGDSNVYIGPSGMCITGVGGYIQPVQDADGSSVSGTGQISVRIIKPGAGGYTVPPHPLWGVTYTGPVETGAALGNVFLGGGLDEGPHNFALLQASVNCYVAYGHQWIWVVPL